MAPHWMARGGWIAADALGPAHVAPRRIARWRTAPCGPHAVIFAVHVDERALHVFASETDASIGWAAPGVEAGRWLFWNAAGEPLEPHFLKPNQRGLFVVEHGAYQLRPACRGRYAPLEEALEAVVHFDASAPFNCRSGVLASLMR